MRKSAGDLAILYIGGQGALFENTAKSLWLLGSLLIQWLRAERRTISRAGTLRTS
jgi:hypothetical protein